MSSDYQSKDKHAKFTVNTPKLLYIHKAVLRNSEPGFVFVQITEPEMEFPVLVVDFWKIWSSLNRQRKVLESVNNETRP